MEGRGSHPSCPRPSPQAAGRRGPVRPHLRPTHHIGADGVQHFPTGSACPLHSSPTAPTRQLPVNCGLNPLPYKSQRVFLSFGCFGFVGVFVLRGVLFCACFCFVRVFVLCVFFSARVFVCVFVLCVFLFCACFCFELAFSIPFSFPNCRMESVVEASALLREARDLGCALFRGACFYFGRFQPKPACVFL